MSLLLFEGFDDGLVSQRWAGNPPTPASNPYSRQGLGLFTDTESASYLLDATEEHATITIGTWRTITQLGPASTTFPDGIRFLSDSNSVVHIWVGSSASGQLIVFRGTTEIGRTDIIYSAPGISRYLEIQVTLHDTAGAVAIWSDGAQVLNLTNIDTRNGGTKAVIDTVQILGSAAAPNQTESWWDDIYITNGAGAAPYNGNLGDIVVVTLASNGNGQYSDFVGSDGNSVDNYLHTDELPSHDADTTYVESTTDTDRDSYEFTDLPYSTGIIRGVIVTAVARQLGAADNLQITTRIATTDYDGPTLAVPAAYNAELTRIMELSPATTAAWTIAEIDAAEFGIENVT